MTAQDLLRDLEAQGVELRAEGDLLRWRAPPGVVTPETLATLRQHKPDLLRLLTEERPVPYIDHRGDLVVPFGSDPSLCWWQGGKRIAQTLEDLDASAAVRAVHEWLH